MHEIISTPEILSMICFRFPAYKVRNELATIDHNHHCNRRQAKNEHGDLLYSRRWSKKAGRWIPTVIKEPKDYAYIPYLLALILSTRRYDKGKVERQAPLSTEDPRRRRSTIAKLPPRPTNVLVNEKKTRF